MGMLCLRLVESTRFLLPTTNLRPATPCNTMADGDENQRQAVSAHWPPPIGSSIGSPHGWNSSRRIWSLDYLLTRTRLATDNEGSTSELAPELRRLLQRIDADDGRGDHLQFSAITPQVFQRLHHQLGRRGRVTYFGSESGILLVKMANHKHEQAVVVIGNGVRDQGVVMGLGEEIYRIGAPLYESVHQNAAAAKQPDDGFSPFPARRIGDFPTFVLEVANAQSLTHVRKAKDWWLENSDPQHPRGDVKLVLITYLVSDDRSTIQFELWRRGRNQAARRATIQLRSAENPPPLVGGDDPDY